MATPTADAGVSGGSSLSANGQDNAPWKIFAAGHPKRPLQVRVVVVSMHDALRIGPKHVLVVRPERNSATLEPSAVRLKAFSVAEHQCGVPGRTPSTSERGIAQPGGGMLQVGQRMAVGFTG